ncbi:mitochondrial import inner membrane translocase subunit Tim10 B [Cololabis saira]|uniref:mitochondrial import inner membrane translocase subunit Tim10 B n=1 Tax=Cololabis saira TaxID=129043 RepID=UPI002AD3D777|nr:mitochondrial import inner membrane translocase subunit Tim10 B [Cololabis saira]
MEPDQQLRNLRDFLLVYNRMTEICFQRCSSNFNYRNLTMDEERCVDQCAGKLIRSNHHLMGTYVQLMPRMVQRRMEEMESKAAEMESKAAAAALEASPPPQASPPSEASLPPQASPPPPGLPPTELPQEVHGSVLGSAGSDLPADPGFGAVGLSAALTPTPKTNAEAAASGPAGLPPPEAQVHAGSTPTP